MSDILLHGAAGSPFVRKVRIVLSEKGLAYEHVQTIPVSDPPPGLPFPGITPELKPIPRSGRSRSPESVTAGWPTPPSSLPTWIACTLIRRSIRPTPGTTRGRCGSRST